MRCGQRSSGHDGSHAGAPRQPRLSRGRQWDDKISAISNHQTPNTASYFYNYRGYGGIWDRVLTVYAGDHRLNRADDRFNDIIDGIHVCGSVPNPWQPNRP
jgi:hypothetical protein